MEYVKVMNENGELNEELTMLENARIKGQFRMLDRFDDYFSEYPVNHKRKCEDCAHRDKYGVCTRIRDIFGYELIVHDECIFSNNFTFTEVE